MTKPDETVTTRAKATVTREAYQGRRDRAKVRAASYDRPLIAVLALGVTAEMMTLLMDPDSELRPKSAKEAAEVSRIMLDLARKELGEGDVKPEDANADTRAQLIERSKQLLDAINASPGALSLHAGGPVAVPDLAPEAI